MEGGRRTWFGTFPRSWRWLWHYQIRLGKKDTLYSFCLHLKCTFTLSRSLYSFPGKAGTWWVHWLVVWGNGPQVSGLSLHHPAVIRTYSNCLKRWCYQRSVLVRKLRWLSGNLTCLVENVQGPFMRCEVVLERCDGFRLMTLQTCKHSWPDLHVLGFL